MATLADELTFIPPNLSPDNNHRATPQGIEDAVGEREGSVGNRLAAHEDRGLVRLRERAGERPDLHERHPSAAEVGRGVCTSCSNANLENAQLVELHRLAFQQQLSQTVLHLHQYTADGTLGEHAVVVGHVGDKFLERHPLVCGTGVVFHVATGRLLVLVLILFVTDLSKQSLKVLWHYRHYKDTPSS